MIGRFTTIEPIPDEEDQESWTPHHYCFNNPIKNIDPAGKNPILGFTVGAGVDYGFQVAGNFMAGKTGTKAFTNVDLKSIAITGVAGAATMGLSAIGGKGAQIAISTSIDAGESVAKQLSNNQSVSTATK